MRRILQDDPTRPRRLNPSVPIDLETIVLKAMSRAPEDRYATAQELADDLGRYLHDEPIQGRRITFATRLKHWATQYQRLRDSGLMTMGFGLIFTPWTIAGIMFVWFGLVFHPQRPGDYILQASLVLALDTIPSIWLGWAIMKGRYWALWASLIISLIRFRVQVGCALGWPPDFGGLYDDAQFKRQIFLFLSIWSLLLLIMQAVALVAYHASGLRAVRKGTGGPGRSGRRRDA